MLPEPSPIRAYPSPARCGSPRLPASWSVFGPPGPKAPALEIPPQIRVQHPVLEVAVGGANRTLKPRGNEDSDRGHPVGVHVHEPEDLGLGIPERVEDRARRKVHVVPQVNHHLGADGPIALVMAFRQAEALVDLPADRADGPVADDGEGGADVHARHEARLGVPLPVGALVDQSHPDHAALLEKRPRHRRSRPDLHQPGSHYLGADPLRELPDGEEESAFLAQEGGNVGKRQRRSLIGKRPSKGADEPVGHTERRRPPAGAVRIQEVEQPLLRDRGSHGDLGRIQVGKRGADPPGARDHA